MSWELLGNILGLSWGTFGGPKRLGKQDPEDASAWSKFDDDEPRKGKILYKKFKIGLRLDFPHLFLSLALEFFKLDEDEG